MCVMDVCVLALLGIYLFLHCSNSLIFLSMLQYCHMAGEWLFLMFRIECDDMFSFLHGRWLYYSVPRTEGPSKEECHCGIIYWVVGYCGWAKGYQGTFQMFCLTPDQILLPLPLMQSHWFPTRNFRLCFYLLTVTGKFIIWYQRLQWY